ncbi:MAG TPA: protein-L-isoaspartate(D-aspartate) O-methyltransferase [Kiritimatiellia bacterium]|nr:protein-L-isoaspartate(D-aspartate) O-methyltransferase [Kiritimatiellia bacterium]
MAVRGFPALALLAVTGGCSGASEHPPQEEGMTDKAVGMVEVLKAYGLRDPDVLRAMGKVRRPEYIPERYRDGSDPWGDHPCSIGHGQTISQPFIVAYMTERMAPWKGEKFLEIGTGSGYQAAVLAELGAEVFTIEIIPELAEHARRALAAEGYARVNVRAGDGYRGWPEHAPFDAILVTCAPEEIPPALVDQLKDGGRMILPVGEAGAQRLVILRKKDGRVTVEDDLPVRFVPMVRGR